MTFDIASWRSYLRRNRHDLLRIGAQTAVATLVTYLVADRVEAFDVSWAVIAALFTIGLSADASYYNARGRIIGALLGLGLGLVAGWAAPGAVLAGLIVAVVVANMLATIWPSIRYAAVTAAIVALEPTPSVAEALALAGAILCGTLIAAATSFVFWPTLSRTRVVHCLRAAVVDCRDLFALVSGRTQAATDPAEIEALHGRFLGHLESCQARISDTRFGRTTLPSGAGLDEAAAAVESLWHSIVILDRTMRDESPAMGTDTMWDLAPVLDEVQRRGATQLDAIAAALDDVEKDPETNHLQAAVQRARNRIEAALGRPGSPGSRSQGLYALLFALAEIELTLGKLRSVVLGPDPGTPADVASRAS
jgi:uncharacterized membrane protein YccC